MTFADELERLHEAATPGPWRECCHGTEDGCHHRLIWSIPTDCVVLWAVTHEDDDITGGEGVEMEQATKNALAAVAAFNATPALIAVLRATEAVHAEVYLTGEIRHNHPDIRALRDAMADLEVGSESAGSRGDGGEEE